MITKRLRPKEAKPSPLKFCLLLVLSAWLCVVLPSFTIVPSANSVAQVVSQAEPQTLERQGKALYEAGRFTEAIAVLQQAIEAYQQQGDTLRQAIALSNLALTYHQLGNWTQANQAIDISLNLLNQTADSGDRLQATAQALDIQGRLQLAQGQVEQALATWQQAAQHYEQLGDRDRLLRNQIEQSRALQTLGFYQRAIALLTDLEQSLQAQPDSLTKVA